MNTSLKVTDNTSRLCVCSGNVYGTDVPGARRPLPTSRGPRIRSNKNYQTLPSQQRHPVEPVQPLKQTSMHCADYPRVTAHAVTVDRNATGNSYGGRLSSDDDNENCNRRRQLLYAVSDVDLTSSVDHQEYSTWKHPPSSTDLSPAANANAPDQCTAMFGGLLRGGISLQALPDTHL